MFRKNVFEVIFGCRSKLNFSDIDFNFPSFQLCFEKRESENIKERRKIYAARDFSDKHDFALFEFQAV